MEITKITEQDKEGIVKVYLEAVLMPNGELMRYGKSLGYIKDDEKGVFKDVLDGN